MDIQHAQGADRGAFYIELDGTRAGEMTYSRHGDTVTILHTEVSDALRGKGAGRQLLEATVRWAREAGIQIIPVCPFAKAGFDKDPALRDVLAG